MSNFFKFSLRRLLKDRYYSAISILSLALGISCALIIFLYVLSELTYDHYHKNYERIYRVTSEFSGLKIENSGYEIGPLLAAENPQFQNFVRFREAYESEFRVDESSNSWDDVFLADSSVFDIFTFEVIEGGIDTAFEDPFSIAVNKSFASYYFPDNSAVGKSLSTDEYDFKITLVYEDFPENVSQDFTALLPFSLLEIYGRESRLASNERFVSGPNYTYILAPSTFNPDLIAEASANIMDRTIGPELSSQEFDLRHNLLALSDLHFDVADLGASQQRGDIASIYSFSGVAIILLLTACINYINLSTARASVRSHEIWVRRILGANKAILITQSLTESALMTSFAFLMAILVAIALLKLNFIEEFTGKTELVELLFQPAVLAVVVIGSFLVSLIAGIYPAFKLATQSTIHHSEFVKIGWRRFFSLRQVLVFVQLTVSVAIISCVLIMSSQLRYMDSSYLGFKKDGQLIVRLRGGDLIGNLPAIRNELLRHQDISSVSNMQRAPGSGYSVSVGQVESNNGEKVFKSYNSLAVGEYLFETLEIELLQGRTETGEQQNPNSLPVWVNEAFVKDMEWSQPIGKLIGDNEVIGVTTDFHFTPMHEPVGPLAITQYSAEDYRNLPEPRRSRTSTDMIVSIDSNNLVEISNYIDRVLTQFSSQELPDKRFMASIWSEAYSDDKKSMQLIGSFAVISVLISLLGLAGLASFTAQQKTKEIAIRKILGSSVEEILRLLASNFLVLLVLIITPSVLIGYLAASSWLERFAYQTTITALPFVLAIFIVGAVSITILMLHVYRAANSNPVNSLRFE